MKIGIKITETESGEDTITETSYAYGNSLPDGYDDITSVASTINIGNILLKDYKWTRKALQAFDFDSLSDDEKRKVAQHKATSETNCKAILGDTYTKWMSIFDLKSQETRKIRIANVKSILFANVSLTDRYTILGMLMQNPTLLDNYTTQGVEGTTDGDPITGLFNFVEATEAFEGTGIAAMNLTMINGLSKEELITLMMDCLRNGNY